MAGPIIHLPLRSGGASAYRRLSVLASLSVTSAFCVSTHLSTVGSVRFPRGFDTYRDDAIMAALSRS